jgi:hypothetical protein
MYGKKCTQKMLAAFVFGSNIMADFFSPYTKFYLKSMHLFYSETIKQGRRKHGWVRGRE